MTTSFYLDTKKRENTIKAISLNLKNLMSLGQKNANKLDLDKVKRDSLIRDLEKIDRFCKQNLSSYKAAGMAVFSCSGDDFWQPFDLPSSPRNRIIFDHDPYLRPLSAILNEHPRICTFVIDRKEAKWYDIFLGDIFLLENLTSDVPSKVKEGGWEGYESKRIERHIATHLRDFFKESSKKTSDLFKKHRFDWFFLGCKDEHCTIFKALLHPYMKKRFKGRLRVGPSNSPSQVLQSSLEKIKELKIQEKETILEAFISELEKGGLSDSGLKNSLRRLNSGEVQALLVTRYFSKQGKVCPKCRFLYADETECPSCRVKTEDRIDIIDDAVESALDKKAEVRHINPPSKLRHYGNIGVLLRYKS